jgi:hypothetical protein
VPGRFRVVGIAEGESRIGVADLAYASRPDFVLSRIEAFKAVFAREGGKATSDAYLREAKDAEGRTAFRVWDEDYFRRQTRRMLANLPLILNAVVGAITVVIALVVILLNLISFQARADEFALLLAVGRTRRRLVGKLLVESGVVARLLGPVCASSSRPRPSRSASSIPIPSRAPRSSPSSPRPRARSCSRCASPAWTRCP